MPALAWPILVAVGSTSALAWSSIQDYLNGTDGQVINVQPGGVVNVDNEKPGLGALDVAKYAAIGMAVWWVYRAVSK